MFGKKSLLPMFIYDKRYIIEDFIFKINQEAEKCNSNNNENMNSSNNSPYYAILNYYKDQDQALLDIRVNIKHNLINTSGYGLDMKLYYNLIEILARNILNDKRFIMEKDNKLHLDNLYDQFYAYCKTKEFVEIFIPESIDSENESSNACCHNDHKEKK
jgi:hypothetical protein